MTHLHIPVPAITCGMLARTHELKMRCPPGGGGGGGGGMYSHTLPIQVCAAQTG